MKNCFFEDCDKCPEPDFSECEAFHEKILKELTEQNKVVTDFTQIDENTPLFYP